MSVLIKGMEMPKACFQCRFYDDEESFCRAVRSFVDERVAQKQRYRNCPLVETVRVTSAKIVANEDALRIPAEAIKRELVYELAKEVASVTSWKVQDVPKLNSKEVRMSLVIVPEERGVQSVRVD